MPNLGVLSGIAGGLEKATNTLLQIQMAKQKMAQDAEETKAVIGAKKAQTKMVEMQISNMEKLASRDQQNYIKGLQFMVNEEGQMVANPSFDANSMTPDRATGISTMSNPQQKQIFAPTQPQIQTLYKDGKPYERPVAGKGMGMGMETGFAQKAFQALGTSSTPQQLQEALKKERPDVYNYYKQIAESKIPIMGRFGMAANQVSEDVVNFFPEYDPSKYQARERTRVDFTQGNAAKNIRSLNTATQHLDELVKLVPTLGNGSFMKANSVKNWLSRNMGQIGVARFNFIKNAVSGELSTLFKNSGGTDQEIENLRQAIDTSDSPANLYDVISKGAPNLMKGRMDALDWQWKTAFSNEDDKPFPIMSPNSKKVFKKLGILDEQGAEQGAGQGNVPAVGTVEGGYKFKGGDPADQNSWEKI